MIDETILKAVAALRRDALQLSAAAHHHQRDAATPVIAGCFHRLSSVLKDFGHGLESAVAARQ
jgi:hypothetical protein